MNTKSPLTVAVIGAGMAGLTCARDLAGHGARVVVFDKGRGLGGRMATRRAEGGFQFDHGAQYLTPRTSEFTALLQDAEASGAAGRWEMEDGKTGVVGTPGMTGLAKFLARDLDVRSGTQVREITRAEDRWSLSWDGGKDVFDRVVVTVPAPQLAALLPEDNAFAQAAASVEMRPCLTLMVGFSAALPLPFTTRRAPDEALSWIACESGKPGRPQSTCIVAQAGQDWSLRHLELDRDAMAARMMHLMHDVFGAELMAEPAYVSAHRWRYAFVSSPLGRPYLAHPDRTLFAGGDWCLGAKAEDAWASGRAIAAEIAGGI